MEPVQLANPDNAFEGGVLDKKWMFNAVAHMNLWHAGEVKLPSTDWGSGKIMVSNTGWVIDLTRLKVPAASQIQTLREFDISVLDNAALTVRVMDGTWMGIRKSGATNAGTRGAYHTLTVANGHKIYLKLDTNTSTLTLLSNATAHQDSPELGLYYTDLATVTVASGIISLNQTRWGPLEYLKRYNDTFALDSSSSSSIHTDYWADYKPYDSAGVLRTGYNSVAWTGDRYYQSVTGSITIDGTSLNIVETKVFSREVTIDSNGGTSDISAEFLKETLAWLIGA